MDRTSRSGFSKAKRRSQGPLSGEGSFSAITLALLFSMSLVGVVCLSAGCLRRGFSWYEVLCAASCVALGIGFVAIGLLEIDWLEQIIGIFGGCYVFFIQWMWASDGSLSDSIGRRRAAVVWVVIGFPTFIWGCLMA
jgi:hypothetical protein